LRIVTPKSGLISSSLILFFFAVLDPAHSQDRFVTPSDSTFLGIPKKPLVLYSAAAYSAATFYLEYKWWWEGKYHAFAFEDDGFLNNYSLGIDKFGHAYTSYLYFNVIYDFMKWADVSEETALWWSIGIPAAHAISIEIGDGFSTYAFSAVDLVANGTGVLYALLQHEVPFFKNIKLKWSYYPSGVIPMDKYFRITDDYDGHIYWVSFNLHELLPRPVDEYWPRFLSLAIGYGGKNISGRPAWLADQLLPTGSPQRKFAVSLDYNLNEIPLEGGLWGVMKDVFDNFHFPAPGVRKVGNEPAQVKPFLIN
jgi:hypothetical protein